MSITCTCMCIVQQDTVYLKTDRYLTATQQSLWPFQVISRSLWTRIQAKLGRGIGSEGQMIEERNDGCWRHALFDSCKPLLVWSVALVFLHFASLSTLECCLKSMKLMKIFWLCSMFSSKNLSHCEELINCASSWPGPGVLFSEWSFSIKVYHLIIHLLHLNYTHLNSYSVPSWYSGNRTWTSLDSPFGNPSLIRRSARE